MLCDRDHGVGSVVSVVKGRTKWREEVEDERVV